MKILYPIVIVLFLSSCVSTTWWPEINSQEMCTDREWKPVGHISSTHIVSNIAGVTPLTAEKYALYSQIPDAQWFRFSAPAVSVWGAFIPWEWDYRYEINAILHSLHGGDSDKIKARRESLKTLIQEYRLLDSSKNDWKIGFLIHALGDSYAHVYQESIQSREYAYGPVIGHLFKRGIAEPDSINDNVENYELFIRALYNSLDTGNGNKMALNEYIAFIRKLERDGDDRFISLNIAKYNENISPPIHYCEHERWSKIVNKSEVSTFLKSVKSRLNSGILQTYEVR